MKYGLGTVGGNGLAESLPYAPYSKELLDDQMTQFEKSGNDMYSAGKACNKAAYDAAYSKGSKIWNNWVDADLTSYWTTGGCSKFSACEKVRQLGKVWDEKRDSAKQFLASYGCTGKASDSPIVIPPDPSPVKPPQKVDPKTNKKVPDTSFFMPTESGLSSTTLFLIGGGLLAVSAIIYFVTRKDK